MDRRISYQIDEKHHNMLVGHFLKERGISHAVQIQLKKDPEGIKKNNVHAWINETLAVGDRLDIFLKETEASEHIEPTPSHLKVLYEDEDLLVINKAYNTPIHPSVNNHGNTLANHVMYFSQQKGERYPFRCINRLDRDTTGVTLIAKNQISASVLSKQVAEQQIEKIYIAFVEGITEECGTIELPIGRGEGSIIVRKIDRIAGQHAVTHYERLETFNIDNSPVSVVALHLETGRTHQIRVHMAAIGHPLIGDFLYNKNEHMFNRQALHVSQCCFSHPISGEPLCIKAPMYEDMEDLLPHKNV